MMRSRGHNITYEFLNLSFQFFLSLIIVVKIFNIIITILAIKNIIIIAIIIIILLTL